jgi:hypothetical protein
VRALARLRGAPVHLASEGGTVFASADIGSLSPRDLRRSARAQSLARFGSGLSTEPRLTVEICIHESTGVHVDERRLV